MSNGGFISISRLFQGTWEGENNIVVGIDIGTTQSEVSFVVLEEGHRPQVQRVSSWPGQETQNASSKVPTLVWYDTDKEAVSFGAEALTPQAEKNAKNNGWQLAKHFKLHVHSENTRNEHGSNLDPLPTGISLSRVYSDFLGYLLRRTRSFFEDKELDGRLLWQSHFSKMVFIITHPNGWTDQEQACLMAAAVAAGLTTAEAASRKIKLVTESEAVAFGSIQRFGLWDAIQIGLKFIVYRHDNDGVYINTYAIASVHPTLTLRELHDLTCLTGIGIHSVSEALKRYIRTTLLQTSQCEEIESYTKQGVEDFETFARRNFSRNDTDADSVGRDLRIQLGGSHINIPAAGIRRGHMCLHAAKVESFFEPCVDEIKTFVGPIIKETHISFVFSIGEIWEIPYLRQALEEYCIPQGCQVLFPNDRATISHDSILWYIANNPTECRSQMSFGFETSVQFDYNISEHRGRLVTLAPSGLKIIRGRWEEIACELLPLEKSITHTKSMSLTFPSPRPEPSEFKLTLYSYSGDEAPSWMRDERGRLLGGFREWFTISVDLMKLSKAIKSRIGAYGITSWILDFDVCLQFDDVGLNAEIQWKETPGEVIQTAPAAIISHYVL